MRITGGNLRGRRLKAPSGATTRPTADRVREAIFNILGPPPPGVRVLDAFAGAGTLGLEALSRGSDEICFIDNSRLALRALGENITALGAETRCFVARGDTLGVLAKSARRAARAAQKGTPATAAASPWSGPFHWVFVDPPYGSDLARRLLDLLGRGDLLAADALVVVEHDRRNRPAPSCGCLVRTDRRRYGDTEISFYGVSTAADRPDADPQLDPEPKGDPSP